MQRLNKVLKPLEKEYDLIVLDCPPTINILAENIFNASDYLLVPLIPTTLSVRACEQMFSFLEKSQYPLENVYVFLSMVDMRKKMHRETCEIVHNTWDRVLQNAIPYLSLIEQMGFTRQPVALFAHNSAAALAYRDLWHEVEQVVLKK